MKDSDEEDESVKHPMQTQHAAGVGFENRERCFRRLSHYSQAVRQTMSEGGIKYASAVIVIVTLRAVTTTALAGQMHQVNKPVAVKHDAGEHSQSERGLQEEKKWLDPPLTDRLAPQVATHVPERQDILLLASY